MNFKSLIIETSEQEEFKFKPIEKILKDPVLNIEYGISDEEQHYKLQYIIRKNYGHIMLLYDLQDYEFIHLGNCTINLSNIIDSDLDKIYFEYEDNSKISLRDYIYLHNMIQSPKCEVKFRNAKKYNISNQDTLQKAQMYLNKYINNKSNRIHYGISINISRIYPNLCLDY